MSAYLHYGMVSPMRVAREAAAIKGEGGEKYLDELLIWRELAYAFCFHRADHDQWSALPEWAQATMQTHAGDPRPAFYSWEQLARAQTNDAFWNAAQTSLPTSLSGRILAGNGFVPLAAASPATGARERGFRSGN
jgi:deoxyribodipyrimidine photolyase